MTPPRVQLGRSELRVSRVALGTVFRSEPDDDAAIGVIRAALDAGCNFIDCANVYLGGRAESIVGRAVAEWRGQRDRLVIATKVGSQSGRLSAEAIRTEAERSLRRLRRDCIDLLLFHHPDPDTPVGESLRAADDLVLAGKVRHIGCCNCDAAALRSALSASADAGLSAFVCNQVPYSLVDRGIERELVPTCLTHGVSVTAFCVTLIGLLTGSVRHGQAPPPDSPWFRGPYNFRAAMTPRLDRLVQNLIDVGRRHGRTAAQVAIAWVLTRPGVASAIVGAETPEQARENTEAGAWILPDHEAAELERVAAGLTVTIRKDSPRGYDEPAREVAK